MDDEARPAVPAKPSQVPSWVMLGFLLGVACVMAIPRRDPPRPAPPSSPAEPAPSAPRELSTVEDVFEAWGKYAVWSDNMTEVALWNPATRQFSDCYEVLRIGDQLYFRSIPGLTRPVLNHGVAENSPLQFTETARQRAEWLKQVGDENWKAISAGVRDRLPPPPLAKPDDSK